MVIGKTTLAAAMALLLLAGCDDDDGGGGAGGAGGGGDAIVELDGSGGSGDAMVGAGPDADLVDAADMPTAADMAGPSQRCVDACARFEPCIEMACERADRAALVTACVEACESSPPFVSVLGGIDNCPDRVAFVSQSSPEVAQACDTTPPPPPDEPLCEDYGARAAACLAEVCAPAAELGVGADYSFVNFCNTQVAAGNIMPAQLGNIGAAPCDNPLIAPIVEFVVTNTGDPASGSFIELCEDGPQHPAAVCEGACDTLRMCIPEGTPEDMGGGLRDEGLCRLVCGVGIPEVQRDSWPCLATAECAALGACLTDPPPPEPPFDCSGFASRASVCIVEGCPAAEPYGADLIPFIDRLCVQAVTDGEAEADALAMIGPETPCDHEALVGAVSYFTEVIPADEGSGLLVAVCDGMPPANEAALCGSACQALSPCIPPGAGDDDGGALIDQGICRVYCGLSPEVPTDVWQCVDAAADCAAVGACFPDDEGGGEAP